MSAIGWILGIIGAGFIGVLIGLFGIKVFSKILERKIRKDLMNVLNGKRKNEFSLDGKTIIVDRFVITDSNKRDIVVDLKGGYESSDGREDNSEKETTTKKNPFRSIFGR